jgi:hypothetical protein
MPIPYKLAAAGTGALAVGGAAWANARRRALKTFEEQQYEAQTKGCRNLEDVLGGSKVQISSANGKLKER